MASAKAQRDRTTKLGWYSRYGVAECWLVDVSRHTLEVIEFGESVARRRVYSGDDVPRSTVLPAWPFSVSQIFD
jgi:Uma2 family endonuclease